MGTVLLVELKLFRYSFVYKLEIHKGANHVSTVERPNNPNENKYS
jgi:hypothetical protein